MNEENRSNSTPNMIRGDSRPYTVFGVWTGRGTMVRAWNDALCSNCQCVIVEIDTDACVCVSVSFVRAMLESCNRWIYVQPMTVLRTPDSNVPHSDAHLLPHRQFQTQTRNHLFLMSYSASSTASHRHHRFVTNKLSDLIVIDIITF